MTMEILEDINQTEIIMDAIAILETIADQLAVEHLLTIIEPEIKVTDTIETQEEMKREMLTVLVDEDTIRDRDIKRVICQVK